MSQSTRKYLTPDHDLIGDYGGDVAVVIDADDPRWPEWSATAEAYVPREIPAAERNIAARAARAAAYIAEADPLFFKAQSGEIAEADWMAKRDEIKARYPVEEA